MRNRYGWLAVLLATLFSLHQARAADPLAKFTVDAGAQARIDTPITASLAGLSLPASVCLVEVKGDERTPVPAQVEPGNPPRLSWILSGTTPASAQRTFELLAGDPTEATTVELKEDATGLEIVCAGAKVLRFEHAIMPPPPGAAKEYARSGFVHPLWSPAGKVLTCIHPKDHIHHMGLWNPWTSTEFEGRHVDFWNLKDAQGTVRFVKYLAKTSGPVFGAFHAAQAHVDLRAPGGEKVALNEDLEVRVWNVGGPQKGYWLLDYTSTQRCASFSPLKLLKYRYGGIGFRATEEWQMNNSNYLTSEGKDRKNGHATRARWCNVFGTTAQGPAGIEFMSHPANHNHPEPMRIWPDGYIFFNFCPVQNADWTLQPGNDYVLRYRLYVFDGKTDVQTSERLWADFGNPPKVKVEVR